MIAALLLAAIITERNDLFTTPPDYATFRGTSAAPGIESRWIPFGTYTGGSGGAEITRVTAKLAGVVASIFDGYEERGRIPFSQLPEDIDLKYLYLCRVPNGMYGHYWYDDGEFLQTTNNSTRILDCLNPPGSQIEWRIQGGRYQYYAGRPGDSIERWLAFSHESQNTWYIDGRAAQFGSRALDALVEDGIGSTDPPLSTTWDTTLPFRAEDADNWKTVWPTYAMLTNDTHFFPAVAGLEHTADHCFGDWTDPGFLYDVWGTDVYDAAYALVTNVSSSVLPISMEDVLSRDTGWEYEYPPVETDSWWTASGPLGNFRVGRYEDFGDKIEWDNWEFPRPTNYYVVVQYSRSLDQWMFSIFLAQEPYSLLFQQTASGDEDAEDLDFGEYSAHCTRLYNDADDFGNWTNGTTRLDWKRLGILCQLERQMEITYQARDDEDYLPLQRTSAARDHVYLGEKVVPVLTPEGGMIMTTNFNTRGVEWTLKTQAVEVATTNIGWCFPTARLIYANEVGGESAAPDFSLAIYIPADYFRDAIEDYCEKLHQSGYYYYNGWVEGFMGGTVESLGDRLRANLWTGGTNFMPDDGGDYMWNHVDYDASGDFGPTDEMPSNTTVRLTMEVGKRAMTIQTDGDDFASTSTNLVHYIPTTNVWGRGFVARQSRPSLDVMLDVKGSGYETWTAREDSEAMPWNDIKLAANSRRAFRMNPLSYGEQTSLANMDRNRCRQLQSLDYAVDTRFAALAGTNPDAAARGLVDFAGGEERALIEQLENQEITISAVARPDCSGSDVQIAFGINAHLDDGSEITQIQVDGPTLYWQDESGEYQYHDLTYDAEGDAYLFGHLAFESGNVSITNQVIRVKPVRVDGHQDQMVKTLWRFKNLRDPNL